MAEMGVFIERIKNRTKRYFVNYLNISDSLKDYKASHVMTYQLVKSSPSTEVYYWQRELKS